ncbi:MAG TPA: DNA polymerase Y family protein [Propionibacteriaceae bacterium]|nr:DNA polymerase Y family protein [Propionibacteriaceae bacterium]
MAVWCPDWPVVAAAVQLGLSLQLPLAVFERGEVFACSAMARVEGVRRGMRRRDASARCPELIVLERNAASEVRTFESVLAAIEEISAGVAPVRPGLCALRVPSRFYGGEREAADVVAEHMVGAGIWDFRMGIADGIFAAEHAARRATAQDCWIIPCGGSAVFLAGLSIGVLENAELVTLLRRLGIRSLGDFAALASRDVLTRFGQEGALLHRLARGLDNRPIVSRRPPLDMDQRVLFTPALETVEPIVFSTRRTAERLVAELGHHGLVCTEVRIEVVTEGGWTGSRVWAHSRWFAASDLIDRIYWQLQGDPAPEPVCELRLLPESVESLADHGEGLWGSALNEHVERGIARLQGMLGPEEVLAPSLQGGRNPRERQLLSPWGERRSTQRNHQLPWPGSIPPPAPAQVFSAPMPSVVLSEDHRPVSITDRGLVSAAPAFVGIGEGSELVPIDAWAGPWPIDELWWDPDQARQVARFQVTGLNGSAWLLIVENDQWWTEARYD